MRLSRRTVLALLAPVALHAQAPTKTLTLQDAIQMAQQNGPLAQVARSNRDAARWQDRAFNSRLRPQLFLTGNAANLNHGINAIPQPDGTTQFLGQSQNQSSLQMGFSQRIPLTGGTISVGSQLSVSTHATHASATRIRCSRSVSRPMISRAVFLRGNSPKYSSMYWISSAPVSSGYCLIRYSNVSPWPIAFYYAAAMSQRR